MSLLTASNLTKFYGPDEIFSGITLAVPQRARIALVGPNGAGKTTLLNLLVGLDSPTDGTVNVARSVRSGFLPQRPELAGDHSLWDEQLRAFDDLRETEAELNRLEHAMADPDQHETALAVYGPLQEQFELAGGYTYESRIRMVLHGVGFDKSDFTMPLSKLSGGQKTRALLARLLLDSPDLLVLDEPTNHLDIDAIEWLENFLKDYPGAVIAVSHDRYFMDSFASTTWELDYGTLEVYRGNYSHYIHQRIERHERLLKEYESQQEFIAKEQDYIRKHMGSRWTAQAKGRLKKLETMKKRGKVIQKPRATRKEMNLRIQAAMRSGDRVLMTKGVSVGYPDGNAPLFDVPDITLFRGETAALIGPNGVGKSTFLKTIIGELKPLSGNVTIGASVKVGYFAQAHERLNPRNTLIEEVTAVKSMPVSEARNYLAQFLFTGEDVFRTVETLSGGERGRIALARLALSGANLLLLDEPTNHLDIDSQEVLQSVLSNFDGTVILVSHDRYLIAALATQIWAASSGAMQIFDGPYQEFASELNQRNEITEQNTAYASHDSVQSTNNSPPESAGRQHGLNPFELKRRLEEIETYIHILETRLEELTAAINNASAAGDAHKVSELGEEFTRTETELHAVMKEWELLAE
jgi:ATP-binding cassette, subfamily F, member 3